MAKAKSLIEEVSDNLPRAKGLRPWYETLPSDLQSECEQIKAAWRAGKMGTKTGLAWTLSRSLKARGIEIGHYGIVRWLEKA
jgi:hypothetical protein